MVQLAPAALEDWLRDYYFAAEIDISSSGVQPFSMAEVRELVGLALEDFDTVIFQDSRSRGDPLLCQAIAERWGSGDPEWVMATNGSSEAIFLLMNVLLRPGDEVVVADPSYHALAQIAEGLGCQMIRWPLRFEQQFAPDLEELHALLSPRTRMVVVNFPHNPTGASLPAQGQRRLIDAVAQVGAYLVWDAVFAELVHDDQPLVDTSTIYERGISIGTLSKAYGLPGLRVGWCLAPPQVLARCVQLRDYTTLALSPLVELVARHAVQNADALLAPRRAQARRNLETLTAWVARHADQAAWVRPTGGVVAFPQLCQVNDVEAFCHALMRRHGTLLVPGTCFGRPGHVRLGFGGDEAEFEEGLARLGQLLVTEGAAG